MLRVLTKRYEHVLITTVLVLICVLPCAYALSSPAALISAPAAGKLLQITELEGIFNAWAWKIIVALGGLIVAGCGAVVKVLATRATRVVDTVNGLTSKVIPELNTKLDKSVGDLNNKIDIQNNGANIRFSEIDRQHQRIISDVHQYAQAAAGSAEQLHRVTQDVQRVQHDVLHVQHRVDAIASRMQITGQEIDLFAARDRPQHPDSETGQPPPLPTAPTAVRLVRNKSNR